MEQPRMLMGGYEPKRSNDCLNLAKKNIRIIVEYSLQAKLLPEEPRDIYGHFL